jgi:gliding motility-associated-like protein
LPIEVIVTPDSITLPLGGSQQVLVTYLNATNPTYNWVPSQGFSCVDCPNPVVSAFAPGTYVITVSMVNQGATCYGSATLYVAVGSHRRMYMPNAFTPNGDGNNDKFEIYGEDIKTISLKIFNRWGEKVFETTNSLAGWDGTYKGVVQSPGVYTYEANVTYLDNSQETKNGTITLIK